MDLCKGHIDINFSGSTCVTCLIYNGNIYTANLGDSRAIIVSSNKIITIHIIQYFSYLVFLIENKNQKWVSKPLSKDHKPDDDIEK